MLGIRLVALLVLFGFGLPHGGFAQAMKHDPVTKTPPVTKDSVTKDPLIKDPENTLIMMLKTGRVVIEMRPDLAPHHVARIKQLVRRGFYDGLVFHRVIANMMAQTGDPTGTGAGGTGYKIQAEFSNEHHLRGTVSMARTSDPNSADSQFFICFAPQPKLDGRYSIWGQVIEGMENVDKIAKGDEFDDGKVYHPDHIIWMKVAADMKE